MNNGKGDMNHDKGDVSQGCGDVQHGNGDMNRDQDGVKIKQPLNTIVWFNWVYVVNLYV